VMMMMMIDDDDVDEDGRGLPFLYIFSISCANDLLYGVCLHRDPFDIGTRPNKPPTV